MFFGLNQNFAITNTTIFLLIFNLQKVEDNDEAEQIIRAITHGEIDHSVYSQMADDLENAAQQKRKEKKVGKKVGEKGDDQVGKCSLGACIWQ